jgi:hypothetical protein
MNSTCLCDEAYKHIIINTPTGIMLMTSASHGGIDSNPTIITPNISMKIVPGVRIAAIYENMTCIKIPS